MAEHNIIGKQGEKIAVEIMRKKGFRILETNWRFGYLEMDIIAANRKEIAFVEVKTRTSTYGDKRPEEYVDMTKKKRMTAAANAYIKKNGIELAPRFDVIGILLDPTTGKVQYINHIENAFPPPMRTIGRNSFSGFNRWHHRGNVIK